MDPKKFAPPYYILFLVLPAGISFGFASITLPYLLTKNGFSVAHTAAIVALGLSANLWRFLWGPIADLTLSLKRWYWIGVLTTVAGLFLLCITPYTLKGAAWLTGIVFFSQVAATFVLLPVGGFMANRIEESKKGMAGGWFQAGNLGGVGLGGGAGLWLATHYSVPVAGVVLCAACLLSALIIWKMEDVWPAKDRNLIKELVIMGKDLWTMIRLPVVLFVVILICLPVGSGGAGYLWSAIASDWNVSADTVALTTGILNGIISGLGCVAGGYVSDKWNVWVSYLGSGILCALVTAVMAMFPYQPAVYVAGVLSYSFAVGMVYGAFSAVTLFAIGKRNASTKYSLLSSLSNLPVVYMTAFDGWAHDRHNSKYMLVAESVLCVIPVVICVFVLQRMNARHLLIRNPD